MNDKIHMSLKGHFLIAMPGLLDPNFSRSVVCICEHTGEGSLGLVVNRAYPSLLSKDIFEELGIEYLPEKADIPIFFGGPVHMDELFILHGPPFDWGPSVVIVPSLAMSNNRAILEAIALGRGARRLPDHPGLLRLGARPDGIRDDGKRLAQHPALPRCHF